MDDIRTRLGDVFHTSHLVNEDCGIYRHWDSSPSSCCVLSHKYRIIW